MVNVARTPPRIAMRGIGTDVRRVGGWRITAIQVPEIVTVVALDHLAFAARGLPALNAENDLMRTVRSFEIVRMLIAISATFSSASSLANKSRLLYDNLQWELFHPVKVGAIRLRLNILKVILNLSRQRECARVGAVQSLEERCQRHERANVILLRAQTRRALIAEEGALRSLLTRRIKA
jgi:hypothetical protein